MRRHAIGIIALLLLCGAVYFWIQPPEGLGRQLEAACWRGGALAVVLWLAFADVQRMPTWLFGLFLALVVIVALKPRTAMLAVPVIIALAVLRPRFGRRQ